MFREHYILDNNEIKEGENKILKNIKFDGSISEIKDNKDINISANYLNVSYLSLINKNNNNNNLSCTTKNEEYRSTDNISTKSKKKKLIKVFSGKNENCELENSFKIDYAKNTKESSDIKYFINNNNDLKMKKDINSNYNNKAIDKDKKNLINNNDSNDDIYFNKKNLNETKNFYNNYNNFIYSNNESILECENKLRNLFMKFEKSRTISLINSHLKKNSNLSLNLNFKKEISNEKVFIDILKLDILVVTEKYYLILKK